MNRLVQPRGEPSGRLVTPIDPKNLKWYHNNPWVIGGVVAATAIGIVLIFVF